MKFLFYIGFILISVSNYAQMLNNERGEVLGDRPFFNSNYIRDNKIRRIDGHYISKRPMDVLRQSQDFYTFIFNRDGKLIQDFKTMFNDTLMSYYGYDADGRLILVRKSQGQEFYTYEYQYDSKNRMIKSQFKKEENRGANKFDFKPGNSTQLSFETYTYHDLTDSSYMKKCFNTEGNLFKEEIYLFDHQQRLKSIESRQKTGSGLSIITYMYNDKGLLTHMEITSILMSKNITTYSFEYENNGAIRSRYYYRNGVYVNESQIVYSSKHGHLESFIIREEATNYLTIIKFDNYYYFN